ncbi:helix-turn-helix domain-containing protein [Pseudomonas sp. COR58]|uniref:Helix-turn-helix domain-containing protein n=1 Tax=Pseudomonas ekonensis TaxID=2842353 RepID=A0ABS6PFD9_9PSED|nr:helix-turn-helix domain-containing protein [Pseudomonas ekonensis]MBV4459192.1 helix-turn-helix domain-containing protein [Pseudomonas ekonensis]
MSLLFNCRPLVINPQLAERIGLNEAIVLQQLSYWLSDTTSGVEHEGRRWIYNTIEQWQKQFPFWSADTVKRTLTSLQKQGLVMVEKLARAKHDQTNHYTINYQAAALIEQGILHRSEEGNLPQSVGARCPDLLTEITTKTTTENSSCSQESPLEGFEQFWKLYPNKKGKKEACRRWAKLKPDPGLRQTLMTALSDHCLSRDWVKDYGRFVPMASTWLFGERWNDVLTPAGASSNSAYHGLPNHTHEMYPEKKNGSNF